jgi:hypothetical protein
MADIKNDQTFREQLGSNTRFFLQEASKRWNSLSVEEKQKYNDMAQVYKEQYKQYHANK